MNLYTLNTLKGLLYDLSGNYEIAYVVRQLRKQNSKLKTTGPINHQYKKSKYLMQHIQP